MPVPDSIKQFWRTTWTAWRSGALSALSDVFQQAGRQEFAWFLRSSPDFNNPSLDEFLQAHPPRPAEFLILFHQPGDRVVCAMTSQRLWMHDQTTETLVELELSQVAELEYEVERMLRMEFRLKDGTVRTFEKIPEAPKEAFLRFALERAGSPEGWKLPTASAESNSLEPDPIVSTPTPGPDETLCSVCRNVISKSPWSCPRCGTIHEGLLLATINPKSLPAPDKEAYSQGYEDCRKRWKQTKDIAAPISEYRPTPGREDIYRAGWKKAADRLEAKGGLAETLSLLRSENPKALSGVLMVGGLGIFFVTLGNDAPKELLFILTPLALIVVFAGLTLYFSSPD